eukprot:scaffold27_cov125-Isochrysis_galbana.AAC.2
MCCPTAVPICHEVRPRPGEERERARTASWGPRINQAPKSLRCYTRTHHLRYTCAHHISCKHVRALLYRNQ